MIACQRRRRKGRRVRRITVDLDPTVDPTHGSQQKTLFSGFHRRWCYLPLAGFLTFDGEPEQHLFCCVLRPGRASDKLGCLGVLRRLLPRLRRAFPGARVRIRLDSGFAGPELFEFFEAQRLEYVVGMKAERGAGAPGGAVDGAGAGRVRVRPGRGVPSLRRVPVPRRQPGAGLELDRTSCTGFLANHFRVLLTAAACALMQELRHHARHTGCARTQIGTLRLRLLKLGARLQSSARRVVLHLPRDAPFADDWRRIALSVGAVAT